MSARERERLANQFYTNLAQVLLGKRTGYDFHGGLAFNILANEGVFGYRSFTLRINCGIDNERLEKKLSPAIVPQFVPWNVELHKPFVRTSGRWVEIDVAWPKDLQRNKIRLNDISRAQSRHGGQIIIGPNANGVNITLPSHEIHHLLVAGQSGSGKSVLTQSIVTQLSRPPMARGHTKGSLVERPHNWRVHLDGKGGDGLRIVDRLPGQVGPLAITLDATVDALGWCVQEMQRRYKSINDSGGRKLSREIPQLFVIFDEPQTWTKELNHPVVKTLLEKLATQGRSAGIHVVASTQKPTTKVFGKDTATSGQFDAAIGLSVKTAHESRMIVQTDYRCDTLEMQGDAWVAASVPFRVGERVQVAYLTEDELEALPRVSLMMDEWPVCNVEILGQKSVGRKRVVTTDKEWSVCYQAEVEGNGAPWIRKRFQEGKAPGSNRALRIKEQCGRVLDLLKNQGYELRRGTT